MRSSYSLLQAAATQFPQHHLLEMLYFSIVYFWLCSKDQVDVTVWIYFWVIYLFQQCVYLVLCRYQSIHVTMAPYNLSIVILPALLFLLRITLMIWMFLFCYMNSGVFSSVSVIGVLVGIVLNLQVDSGDVVSPA